MPSSPIQPDDATQSQPRWKLALAGVGVLAGAGLFAIDAGNIDRVTNLLGIGLAALAIWWILPSKLTFSTTLGRDPSSPGVPLGRTLSIPTEGAVTDPNEISRLLHEHGVELSEEEVRRAMREGGDVLERSVTISFPPGADPAQAKTTITWNGRQIDQDAVRANGMPARARVTASTDPIPDLFGPDVKLLDLEIVADGAGEPRTIRMVPVIVPAGREHEVQVGATVDVRIDRDDPEVVVVANLPGDL